MNKLVNAIAIDGPVAAGKGTISTLLSEKIHGFHVNTGAMYRCLALYCLTHGISFSQKKEIIMALGGIVFDLEKNIVRMNGEDVTEAIKKREVSQLAAKVATLFDVRSEMVKRQREIGIDKIAKGYVAITEGRDAATKIFPDAKLKIFLTANSSVRAKRRYEQMGGINNHTISFDAILHDTNTRDQRDYERTVDPLVKSPETYGYVVIDNSDMTEEQTVDAVLREWEKKVHENLS